MNWILNTHYTIIECVPGHRIDDEGNEHTDFDKLETRYIEGLNFTNEENSDIIFENEPMFSKIMEEYKKNI